MNTARSAARMLWRHQRLVWWVFVVNLVLAWLSSLPARVTLSSVLDRSLESAKLVSGFDVPTMALMMERPDVAARSLMPSAVGATLLFLAYLLFIDGGVMAVYLEDRKLSRAEFFQNCGLYLWRMVRLALYSLVPFGVLAAAHGGIHQWADKLATDAGPERLGFFVDAVGLVVIAMLALFVRMWFDLAQAQVVRDNERQLLRTVARNFKRALHAGGLYARYLGIGVFAAATLVIGVGVWIYVPHSATGLSFLLLELVTVAQIASRLWMKAASAAWVQMASGEIVAFAPQASEIAQVPPVVPDPGYAE